MPKPIGLTDGLRHLEGVSEVDSRLPGRSLGLGGIIGDLTAIAGFLESDSKVMLNVPSVA